MTPFFKREISLQQSALCLAPDHQLSSLEWKTLEDQELCFAHLCTSQGTHLMLWGSGSTIHLVAS